MQEENTQTNDLTPEEAKASLGLATRLGEQMLMSQMMEAQNSQMQEGEMASQDTPGMPQEPMEEDHSMEDMEAKMDEKMEILRTEMKETIKAEVGSIKNIIKEALNGEED